MRAAEVVELLRAAQTVVVTGAVVVDHYPKCQECGRTLAEYLGRPWSQKCRRCGAQCKSA
jgi:tRNA(Ile2) C34 agmatinyltransferase TiaS